MSALPRPAAVRTVALRGAFVGAAVLVCGVASASGALALGDVQASPKAVVPGGTVTVEGTCPPPVKSAYVRATVGIDAIGRYVVVPVDGGAFSAKFRARGVGGFADPRPGDKLRAQVSCATDASFVANVGTVRVRVVENVLGPGGSTVDQASASSGSSAASGSSPSPRSVQHAAAKDGGAGAPISPWVPITAFAVAAFGTVGAYGLSRYSDRRAAAMAGHPAQRGLGRPPRRDAR